LLSQREGHSIGVSRVLLDLKFFVSRAGKLRAQIFVLRRIAGFENLFAVGSEQLKESCGIVMLSGVNMLGWLPAASQRFAGSLAGARAAFDNHVAEAADRLPVCASGSGPVIP